MEDKILNDFIADLCINQEKLDPYLNKILIDNLWDLYEE